MASGKTSSVVEVRKTMRRIYAAFEKLDATELDSNFEHGPGLLAFGTDWDEKFSGWKQYRDVHTTQFAALKSFEFTSKELEVHVDGRVAWAADRPHWRIELKTGEKVEDDVRITAVLRWDEKRRRWLVVQWHVSSGLKQRMHEY